MTAHIAIRVLMLFVIVAPAQAQWQQVPDRSVPRTLDGEPDLSAPAPRTADGRPDLSGVWLPDANLLPEDGGFELVEGNTPLPLHLIDVMAALEPGETEMEPWAEKLLEQRLESEGLDDPIAYCKPWGITMHAANLLPYKIVQTPDLVLILNEQDTVFRQVFLDGRKPVEDPVPRWLGYSTGRWEDETLVVETTGFTDQTWLDASGHPHTESLHLTQRFRRPNAGHLEIETTVDDPGTYSNPFTYTISATIMPDDDLLEFFCTDNEISSQHYQQ
jgi:hypothetical protein